MTSSRGRRRKLREELGSQVDPDDLALAREMAVEWDFRREHVRVFEVHLRAEPDPRLDNREVVSARFVEPRALLRKPGLPPLIRAYLCVQHSDDQRHPPAEA